MKDETPFTRHANARKMTEDDLEKELEELKAMPSITALQYWWIRKRNALAWWIMATPPERDQMCSCDEWCFCDRCKFEAAKSRRRRTRIWWSHATTEMIERRERRIVLLVWTIVVLAVISIVSTVMRMGGHGT